MHNICITLQTPQATLLSEALGDTVGALVVHDAADLADILEHHPFVPVEDGVGDLPSTVTLYRPADALDEITDALCAVARAAHELGIAYTLDVSASADEDWATNWRQYYDVVRISSDTAVVPHWLSPPPDTRYNVRIEPGLMFGTGTHESTMGSLRMLEAAVKGGERVCDLGTGTGILTIAALLYGASHVYATDVDVGAHVLHENAALNDIGRGQYELHIGDVTHSADFVDAFAHSFDVVVANIVAEVIAGLVPAVAAVIKPGGTFIMGGVIETRRGLVDDALAAHGFTVTRDVTENGWVSLTAVATSTVTV